MERWLRENRALLKLGGAGLSGGLAGGLLVWLTLSRLLPLPAPVGSFQSVTEKRQVTVEESSALIDAVGKVMPSVVSITSAREVQSFFGGTFEVQEGGSGFVIQPSGLIATNRHVVARQGADYTVLTPDGKSYQAQILAQDPVNDLALLKINGRNLPAVTLGDSSKLRVGETVVAIGNALGQYQNTVTAGIISGIGRTIVASDGGGGTERLEGVIQTDASINRGNSGGPLVNLSGQVVGINTAVDISGQSIGFAIPAEYLKTALASFEKTGSIRRAFLGVRYVNLSPELAKQEDLTVTEGALLVGSRQSPAVMPNSPAAKAGLKEGDVIMAINNEKLTTGRGLVLLLQKYQPGESVTLKIRRDGREFEAAVKLSETSS